MPPPLAEVSVGDAVSPRTTLMSSTEIVVELTVVVVPLTVKLPVTTRAFLTVVVPVVAPTVRAVAAPAKLTVVAVVLTKSNDTPDDTKSLAVVVPDTVRPVSVPRLVRLELVSVTGSVVPVIPDAATFFTTASPVVQVNRSSIEVMAVFSLLPQPVSPFSGNGVSPSIKNVGMLSPMSYSYST
jgi:hypothetical protein